MTIKEAQYFKKYIDGRLNDILGAMTQQQLNTLQGQRFAARFMGDIKGQQMFYDDNYAEVRATSLTLKQ